MYSTPAWYGTATEEVKPVRILFSRIKHANYYQIDFLQLLRS
jgi:hypothetical protein